MFDIGVAKLQLNEHEKRISLYSTVAWSTFALLGFIVSMVFDHNKEENIPLVFYALMFLSLMAVLHALFLIRKRKDYYSNVLRNYSSAEAEIIEGLVDNNWEYTDTTSVRYDVRPQLTKSFFKRISYKYFVNNVEYSGVYNTKDLSLVNSSSKLEILYNPSNHKERYVKSIAEDMVGYFNHKEKTNFLVTPSLLILFFLNRLY